MKKYFCRFCDGELVEKLGGKFYVCSLCGRTLFSPATKPQEDEKQRTEKSSKK